MSKVVLQHALTLAKSGRQNEAIEHLKFLVRDRSCRGNATAVMAFCYESKGDLSTALYLYRMAHRFSGGHPHWQKYLRRCEKSYYRQLEEGLLLDEDFEDGDHVECTNCGMRHLKTKRECPFCGAEHEPVREPAFRREPVPAESRHPALQLFQQIVHENIELRKFPSKVRAHS